MVTKRILCSGRIRRVPRQFSWLDHRLVRDKHICRVSHSSLALYLFLVTVSDAEGLSYYSDAAIDRYVHLNGLQIGQARAELMATGLIAYRCPLYQVLSLDAVEDATPLRARVRSIGDGALVSVGDVLLQAMGGVQ